VDGLRLWENALENLVARQVRDHLLVKLVAEVRSKLEGDRPSPLVFTPDQAWLEDDRIELGAVVKQEGLCLLFHLDVGLQHRSYSRSCREEHEAALFLGEITCSVILFSDEFACITVFSL